LSYEETLVIILVLSLIKRLMI